MEVTRKAIWRDKDDASWRVGLPASSQDKPSRARFCAFLQRVAHIHKRVRTWMFTRAYRYYIASIGVHVAYTSHFICEGAICLCIYIYHRDTMHKWSAIKLLDIVKRLYKRLFVYVLMFNLNFQRSWSSLLITCVIKYIEVFFFSLVSRLFQVFMCVSCI